MPYWPDHGLRARAEVVVHAGERLGQPDHELYGPDYDLRAPDDVV